MMKSTKADFFLRLIICQFFIGCCYGIQSHVFEVTMGYGSPDCVERPIALVNGIFPGPTIRVTAGMSIEVKVVNNLVTDAVTIHFHGQRQLGTVWQDGIGMISSCPILPKTSFTYRFKANDAAGTYFYHGHIGGIRSAGLYGMFIIDPTSGKPFVYSKEHLLLLSDWYHAGHTELAVGLLEEKFRWAGDPQSILVNGKGYYNCTKHGVPKQKAFPYYMPSSTVYCADSKCPGHEVVEVEKNTVNMIRIGNIAELSFMNIAIQGHSMTVVEADGQKIKPFNVTSLDINSGQRYAVLVTADQAVGAYWINVKTRHRSRVVTGQAVLKYKNSLLNRPLADAETVMTYQPGWDDSVFSFTQQNNMTGLTSAPTVATRRIVLLGTQERFKWKQGVGYHDHNVGAPESNCNATHGSLRWAVSGTSYRWENTPVAHMVYYNIRTSSLTEKRGYYQIKEGDVVDIIIQNYPACDQVCEQHPWHLHGHKFWVIGMGRGTWNGNATQIASLKPNNATYRDTITVLPDSVKPFGGQQKQGGCGWTAVRFVADNPGVWPFHCHVTWHFIMGMQIVFIESSHKMPVPSNDIPICGDVTPHVFVKTNKLTKEDRCKLDIGLYVGLTLGWCVSVCLLVALVCQFFLMKRSKPRQDIANISIRNTNTLQFKNMRQSEPSNNM